MKKILILLLLAGSLYHPAYGFGFGSVSSFFSNIKDSVCDTNICPTFIQNRTVHYGLASVTALFVIIKTKKFVDDLSQQSTSTKNIQNSNQELSTDKNKKKCLERVHALYLQKFSLEPVRTLERVRALYLQKFFNDNLDRNLIHNNPRHSFKYARST